MKSQQEMRADQITRFPETKTSSNCSIPELMFVKKISSEVKPEKIENPLKKNIYRFTYEEIKPLNSLEQS